MDNGLVSVIVPVYRTEKYLDRCIQSIVNQSYQNLEIILVDDGSPDNCPQICDAWAARDSRIKVIHKENAGLGMARNSGIDHATGEYICFFDSDDYVDAQTIAEAYEMAREYEADMVCFGMHFVDSKGNIVGNRIPNDVKCVYTGEEIQRDFLLKIIDVDSQTGKDYGIPLSACCKLYSARCVHMYCWRFASERDVISEDFYSLMNLFHHLKTVCVLPKAFYYYCENRISLTHTYRTDRFEKICHFYNLMTELCCEIKYPSEVSDRLGGIFLSFVITAMKQEMAASKEMHKKVEKIESILGNELLQNVLVKRKNISVNLKKRILFWAMRKKKVNLCCLLLAAQNRIT